MHGTAVSAEVSLVRDDTTATNGSSSNFFKSLVHLPRKKRTIHWVSLTDIGFEVYGTVGPVRHDDTIVRRSFVTLLASSPTAKERLDAMMVSRERGAGEASPAARRRDVAMPCDYLKNISTALFQHREEVARCAETIGVDRHLKGRRIMVEDDNHL
jgi:hypothetical protein